MTATRKTVLIADDERKWLEVGRTALEDDFNVETLKVDLAGTIVDRVQKGGLDLVVIDLLMPGEEPFGTGLEVCVHLRKNYPHLPVLLWTGAWEEYKHKADRETLERQSGAVVVYKDVLDQQKDDLLARVKALLS